MFALSTFEAVGMWPYMAVNTVPGSRSIELATGPLTISRST